MALPSATDILNLSTDQVASFIAEQASSRTLSILMKDLNAQLLSADEAVRASARDAIERLGFPEYA